MFNQPQAVLEWMRNGKWSKAMDYGEGNASNSGWPDDLPWFKDETGMENIYNGLLTYGFKEKEANQILGGNWFSFLKSGLEPKS